MGSSDVACDTDRGLPDCTFEPGLGGGRGHCLRNRPFLLTIGRVCSHVRPGGRSCDRRRLWVQAVGISVGCRGKRAATEDEGRMRKFRAAVDIGGTFTDVVLLGEDGTVTVRKLASTPDDYARSVLDGLDKAIQDLGIEPSQISELGHGFTVATNAILEGKGARTALVTTEGFRDVLEIARLRVPRLYDLDYQKPPPLVERRLRFEVRERMNFRGEVVLPLDLTDAARVAGQISEAGVTSVAVSLLHAYANPAHEARVGEVIRAGIPDVELSLSSELLPEMREYERTSTTVINAYVRPVVSHYLTRLSRGIREMGIQAPMNAMQSNGGLTPVGAAIAKPMTCIESGPAAGVVGGFHLGKRLGEENLMTFDMGGTTAKASMIESGRMLISQEYEVGGGMSVAHRLMKGSGYVLRVPSIDLAEVSAGGGSIAWVDKGGALQCGPHSAGAVPGPVCYGRGGEDPTVTDANVVLGYLNPEQLLGGSFRLDADRASRAVKERVGGRLGLSESEAAYGIHLLVNASMARALRAVSSERGRDPRRFTLVAFGGGGPVHAAGLAEMLDVSRIIIPPHPGAFSAFGLLFADVRHHFVRSHHRPFSDLDLDAVNAILESLLDEGVRLLRDEGFSDADQRLVAQVDMKYEGQTSELTVNVAERPLTADGLLKLGAAYHREHEKTYGYRVDEPFQLVSIRVIATGVSGARRVPDRIETGSDRESTRPGRRRVYFGPRDRWMETPVAPRAELSRGKISGPLVIEEYDSTTVVPPRWDASLDAANDILLSR